MIATLRSNHLFVKYEFVLPKLSNLYFILRHKIGATGFEPATSRPPAERATKLRHTPIEL